MLAHGWCLFWNHWLIAGHIVGDGVTALAYYMIPLALWSARSRIVDTLGRAVFAAFATFILACGTTHVLDIVVLFSPWYTVQAAVKLLTAVVSIWTAFFLVRIVRTLSAPP